MKASLDAGWPAGAAVAVSFTFDVDAESGFLGDGPEYARRLTTLSEGRFGVVRGLPRILELLAAHAIPATFFVPGHTADAHPAAVRAILDGGHEVGHHGYLHLRTDRISLPEQRDEIERGLAALDRVGAPRPVGYRSPAWEMTEETFDLLAAAGFAYDSSCMGDDRPYVERWSGGRSSSCRSIGRSTTGHGSGGRSTWAGTSVPPTSCSAPGTPSTSRRGPRAAT